MFKKMMELDVTSKNVDSFNAAYVIATGNEPMFENQAELDSAIKQGFVQFTEGKTIVNSDSI